MSDKKKDTEKEIEAKDAEIVETKKERPKRLKKPKKTKFPIEEYTLKRRVKIGGVWREKDDKINLTKEGFAFFRSKNYI